MAQTRFSTALRCVLLMLAVAFGHANGQTADPALVSEYSVALPGEFTYSISAVDVTPSGDAYLSGIRAERAIDSRSDPQFELFVARVNPDGKVVYVMTFPGTIVGLSPSIAVDPSGNAVVVGSHFFEGDRAGNSGFAAKVDPSGELLFMRTLQGTNHAYATAIGPGGRIYVTGFAASADLPTTPDAIQTEKKPGQSGLSTDAYLLILSADGSQILYATYLGGIGDRCLGSVSGCLFGASNSDEGRAVALDGDGNIYVAGVTTADDFPITRGDANVLQGDRSFLTKLTSDGTEMVYSIRYGGAAQRFGAVGPLLFGEMPAGISVDEQGSAYVAGTTYGDNFPTTATAAEGTFEGDNDAFGSDGYVIKFDSVGNLVFSTLLPGAGDQRIGGFARLPTGELLISGSAGAHPRVSAAPTPLGFVAELAPDGTDLVSYQALPPGVAGGPLAELSESSITLVGEESTNSVLSRLVSHSPGRPEITSVVNAASLVATGRVAPGEIISIFGYELELPNGIPMRGGVDVLVNGVAAPVLFTSPNQVNAIVPFGAVSQAEVRIEVHTVAGPSPPLDVRIAKAEPELFTVDGVFAAAINEDGSVNSETNPAPPGSVVSLFGTGGGPYNPPLEAGAIATNDLSHLQSTVFAWADFAEIPVVYAGSAPGLPSGAMQINVRLLSTGTGAVVSTEIQIGVGSVRSKNVLIWFGTTG